MIALRRLARFVVVSLALAGAAVPAAAGTTAKSIAVGVTGKMQATLIEPDGPGPYPGILVLHTSSGLDSADIRFAQALAEQGYVCLVPAFLAAYRISSGARAASFTTYGDKIYADFVAALETLGRSDKVRGSKLGAVGFSNGGYFTAWLAETGKVQAGVAYYGAYSAAGADRDLGRFRAVASPNGAPLLMLHGNDDNTVPVGAARHLDGILRAAQAPHVLHVYDSAGHHFDRDGTAPDAAADSWQRTLAFLAMHLKQP